MNPKLTQTIEPLFPDCVSNHNSNVNSNEDIVPNPNGDNEEFWIVLWSNKQEKMVVTWLALLGKQCHKRL